MDLCNPEELRPVLERNGFRFSKALGQNFLIRRWVPERIAEESLIGKENGVLEIGPGVGCLTRELSLRAGQVASVELDGRLLPVLKETLSDCDNVHIVPADIMKTDIYALTREYFSGLRPAVCANLPYNITSPVLTKLLESGLFERVTVMVQREVAKRLCAGPGDGDYGAFSAFIRYYTQPELLFDVTPDCFMPQPKVWSAVVRMTRREKPPVEVSDEKLFFRVVRGAFALRRKTLENSLGSVFGEFSRPELRERISGAGIDPAVRGETLGLAEFAALSEALRK